MNNKPVNITDEELQLIDAFLNNDLDNKTTIQCKLRIEQDTTWAQKVRDIQLLRIGIQESALRTQLDTFHKDLSYNKIDRKTLRLTWSKVTIAAAVVLLIGLGSYFRFFSNTQSKLYQQYYKPDPGLITAMSISDHYEFEKAMVSYKDGQYEEAIQAWQKLHSIDSNSDTINYFLAMAYQADEKYDLAIQYLNNVVSNKQSGLNKDAHWYLGLIQVKQNKLNDAIYNLQQSGYTKAPELIKKIDKNK